MKEIMNFLPELLRINLVASFVILQSAVTNGHWCGGKRPQCGAPAASLN